MILQWSGHKRGKSSSCSLTFKIHTRYEECKTKLTPFLRKLGFNPKTGGLYNLLQFLVYVHMNVFIDLFFMPVSGLTGANLKEPLTDKWYR